MHVAPVVEDEPQQTGPAPRPDRPGRDGQRAAAVGGALAGGGRAEEDEGPGCAVVVVPARLVQGRVAAARRVGVVYRGAGLDEQAAGFVVVPQRGDPERAEEGRGGTPGDVSDAPRRREGLGQGGGGRRPWRPCGGG
jgi:hypothetical protein